MYHACALAQDGSAYCWGANATANGFASSGALGLGDTLQRTVPTAVHSPVKFTQLEAGCGTTCAVAATGDGYCWGRNDLGMVGDAGGGLITSFRSNPAQVVGGLSFSKIVTKGPHACGLSAGHVYCWGGNTVGELGATTTQTCYSQHPCSSVPVLVQGADTYTNLATSTFATCAVTSSSAVSCWGLNYELLFGVPDGVIPNCSAAPGMSCTAIPTATVSGFQQTG